MKWTEDVARGAWIGPRLDGRAQVGGVVPRGFEAYARLLHPAHADHRGSETDRWGQRLLDEQAEWSWAETARRTGRTVHPLGQWVGIGGSREDELEVGDGWTVRAPAEGFLAPETLAALVPLLAAATTSAEVTIGVWDGWAELHSSSGSVAAASSHSLTPEEIAVRQERHRGERTAAVSADVARALAEGPLLDLPGRRYVLLAGVLAELADSSWPRHAGIGWAAEPDGGDGPMPQLIWPTDQAWCISSEIDLDSTLVGGSRALVDAVLAHPAVEAFEVNEDAELGPRHS